MNRFLLVALTTTAFAVTPPVQAKALKWMAGPPGLPAGAKFAVISGNPGKAGMFTIQAKLPANYVVPPHSHPTDEVVRVITGGNLAYGMGDKADRSAAGSLEKGYHVTLGAGMNHWAATGETPTTISITAMGPFAITYANPADDPRKK
jgi:quercetin dioxygenase-like cupin family protein